MSTQVSKELLETIIKLNDNVASKDETRPFLQGVCLKQSTVKDKFFMVATNGTILSKHYFVSPDIYNMLGELDKVEAIFSSTGIKLLKQFIKDHKTYRYFMLDITHGIATISMNDFVRTSIPLIQRDYPNTSIITRKPKGEKVISFNANELFKLFKAHRIANHDEVIKIYFHDSEVKPIFLETNKNEQEQTSIIMPCMIK